MLTLHADWSVSADEIRVSYRLTNRHSVCAYAYVLPRTAMFGPRPGTAYAQLTPDLTELDLLLGTCEPPAGISVPVRIQPLARAIAPGGEFTGEIRLPVPVREWGAYTNPDDP